MKTIALIALLVTALTPTWASEYSYRFYYEAHGSLGSGCSGPTIYTRIKSSDGYDDEGRMSGSGSQTGLNFAIYNIDGTDGWNGTTGFYHDDIRLPMNPGQTRGIDRIYLWAGIFAPEQEMYVDWPQGGAQWTSGLTYKLTLVSVPTGIQYSGPWEWGFNHERIALPFYSSSDGTTGYRFRMEFTAVPEPSSLLALAAGIGAMGAARRKWRR